MERVLPFAILAAAIFSGCTQLEDARLEGRLRRMARSAYTASPGACNGVAHSHDYAKGFEEGYYDVASGGDGCPPALPPKKYWSATYASPVGREHIEAWFQGFRDGAATARAEGAASYGVISISAEHRVNRQVPLAEAKLPPPQPRMLETASRFEPARPQQSLPLPPPPRIDLPLIETSEDVPHLSKTPPRTAQSSAPREERMACDSNGWRRASPTPSPEVVRVEFKFMESKASSETRTHPSTTTPEEAGWKPATSKPSPLNSSRAISPGR